ncbi:MAG: DUF4276 family protein [Jaaginema sp. PMC 1079.18]|nr:DUF4276 family protein [Jaaginema sp. PMC 1080.18]MEC4852394.1 DUF4276 family protein [Jaaginema sp. PMC 1079.18]MEC4864580.1 DUF4276 family protein [Jaaginema sp. PMC 1078.18]
MSNPSHSQPTCYFFKFGLLVTGKGEERYLPQLFRSLMATEICSFEVIRKIEQLNPITSKARIEIVGSGKKIPSEDEKRIGIPARQYIDSDDCNYVLLIDDLEASREGKAKQVFDRYREVLDAFLLNKRERASVHFLVNMLEAYYFADIQAINQILGTSLQEFDGDVETISHPKGNLKQSYRGFREVEDGGKIIQELDMTRILGNPETCAALRTLFAWCLKILKQYPDSSNLNLNDLEERYHIEDGKLYEITASQL